VVCQTRNGADFEFRFNNTDTQFVSAAHLTNGTYIFLVRATRGARSAATLIFLDVVDAVGTPLASVSVLPQLLAPKLLPQQKLILRGLVNGAGAIPGGHRVMWASLDANLQDGSDVLTSISNINLVLRPGVLQPGRLYRFTMSSFPESLYLTDDLNNGYLITFILIPFFFQI
jgi:hypothetical protein